MDRPLVLLSNDDGYRAGGIQTLASCLEKRFDLVICAPDSEQSASSHALSLHRPLRIFKQGPSRFSVDGTPADSVYVALHQSTMLPRRPDIVVSGMNQGLNLGQDVFYSGTVAAAREGALHGLPALAFSAEAGTDLETAAEDASQVVARLLETGIKPCLLNLNYPREGSWEKCPTVSGRRVYSGGLDERRDPRGRKYYWIGGDSVEHEEEEGTDTEAFDRGRVGITQLRLSLSLSVDDAAVALSLCNELAV